jgi:hypothetical protein
MITFQHQLSIILACLTSLTLFCARLQSTPDDKVVFHDQFEGQLAEGWKWINENSAHWCVRDGKLEIRVVPGLAKTVKNALVRAAPDRSAGTFAIEVDVTNLSEPTQQYEQAGLTLYQDGKPRFKFVKELVDGQLMMIPGRKKIASQTVQLRLIVTADSYTAQYREDGKGDFQTAASGELRPAEKEQISIQCYNGPTDKEHWIRYDNFRIVRLAD